MDTEKTLRKELYRFFGLSFSIAWFFWIPLLLDHIGILNLGLSQSLIPLGIFAPILSASVLTLRKSGKKGLSKLFKGLLKLNVKWYWYLAVLVPAIITTITHLIFSAVFGYKEFIGLDKILVSYFFLSVFLILEEVGWRGYALPRLQQKFSAFKASILLGVIWAFWHFPFWTLIPIEGAPDPFYIFYLTGSLGALIMSIIITWVYNSTKGSLALSAFCHASFNATIGALTFEKSSAIYHNLLFVTLGILASLIIIAIFGKSNLSKLNRIKIE